MFKVGLLKVWQEVLKAPDTVLKYIVNHYRLPLKFLPPSHNQCNNKSTETHQQFVDEAVHGLLANRCIRKVKAEPWVCSPLSVVSNSMGKLPYTAKLWSGKTFAVFMVFQPIAKVFPLNHLLCTVHDGHGLMHCESFPVNSVFYAQP